MFVELSKAYYWLAHGHVRYDADNDALMMRLYETGMACGGNALARYRGRYPGGGSDAGVQSCCSC